MIRNVNAKLLQIFAVAFFLSSCSDKTGDTDYTDPVVTPTVDFNYISVSDGRIRTLHDIRYEVEGEHDLQWLHNNGFEPTGTILFGQYFATTVDKNAEIVISIMQHVPSCDDESTNIEVIRDIQARTTVTKIE